VDADSGLIHTVTTSTAKVHNKAKMKDLFHGEEKAKFRDKGYGYRGLKKKTVQLNMLFALVDLSKARRKLRFST